MMLNPPLPETWRREAERLRRIEQASPAAVYELCADEFDSWWREYGDVVLNLQEAARESGYSPDHLGRMVRQGTLRRIYDEVSIDDQRAEWARVGLA